MKKIYILFLFLGFITISSFSVATDQENNISDENISQNMFPGTWEWENDNQIFRVHLWINTRGATKGHFEMVQVNTNGEETIIYRSDKPMNSATPQHWLPVISGGRQSEKYFMARIMDNSMNYEAPEYQQYEFWQARLDMKIIQIGNTEGIPTKATWKVGYYDITPNNAMPLNIPTDIVLTKVN